VGTLVTIIDTTWPALRPKHHQGIHWKWADILKKHPEKLALIDRTSRIVALWASRKHRPLRLAEGNCYRLDYFEIHPELRGGELGVFSLSLIAARAIELGCSGMVLGSLPGAAQFYKNLGGEQRRVDGWTTTISGTIFLSYATLVDLKEGADELLVEDQEG
jgi:hypothetical protein